MNDELLNGSVFKSLMLFAIPFMLSNLLQVLYGAADLFVVGHFATTSDVSAVSIGSQTMAMLTNLILGFTTGITVLLGQFFGAKKEKELAATVGSSVVLFTMIAVTISIILFLTNHQIVGLMHTPNDAISATRSYLYICSLGTVFIVGYNAVSAILRGLGDSKTPLYFLIISSILNVILDLVFIVNFKMGVSGAAYATNIAQGFSAILCLIYSYKKFRVLRLKKEDFKVESNYYKKHLKIGIPMGLQFSVTAIGIIIVQSAINVFGSTVIASYTASSKVLQLVMQPSTSFGVTIATYAGQNLGAGRFDRIKNGMKIMNKVSIVTSLIAGSVLVFLGKYFVTLFMENPTPEIFKYAQLVFNYSAIFFIPLGFIFVYRNVLQGMGESFVPMMAGFFELAARATVAFTLPKVIGFTGICLSDPIAWISACIPLMITYYRKMKKIELENKGIA